MFVTGHRFDKETPIEETVSTLSAAARARVTRADAVQMQALHDVVKAGYVRYIGMSSCYAYQCESDCRARLCIPLTLA